MALATVWNSVLDVLNVLNLFPEEHAISVRFPQLLFGWLRSLVAHVKFDVAVVKVDCLQLR